MRQPGKKRDSSSSMQTWHEIVHGVARRGGPNVAPCGAPAQRGVFGVASTPRRTRVTSSILSRPLAGLGEPDYNAAKGNGTTPTPKVAAPPPGPRFAMTLIVRCPNPACGVSCSVAEADSGRPVQCAKCGKPFSTRPTLNG